MPSFKIDFEAIIADLAESLFDLYEFAALGDLPQLSIDVIRDMIAEEALHFEDDILTSVPFATNGAGKPVLAFAFSDGFKVHVASCALRRSGHALV